MNNNSLKEELEIARLDADATPPETRRKIGAFVLFIIILTLIILSL